MHIKRGASSIEVTYIFTHMHTTHVHANGLSISNPSQQVSNSMSELTRHRIIEDMLV